jgi:hypothetical protein
MQLLKISFILAFVTSLCSFAYYSTQESSQERLYKQFLSEFEQVDIPNTLLLKAYIVTSKKDSKKELVVKKGKALTKEYTSFIPGIDRGMMSRMGPSTYKAELALATSGKYSAVVYSESRPFDGGTKSYILATFDGKGKKIGRKYLGASNEIVQTELKVNKKMELTVKAIFLEEKAELNAEQKIKKIFITPKGEILVHDTGATSDKKEPIQIQKQVKLKYS